MYRNLSETTSLSLVSLSVVEVVISGAVVEEDALDGLLEDRKVKGRRKGRDNDGYRKDTASAQEEDLGALAYEDKIFFV